ncbi:MAG: M56 family metallopeptidase [Reichenbachiella sp.]|uniref:M56 family metallopeptidase n=1 Tax=Reichenbachiella sp. TaxID=2184521 RepID=UPI0032659BBB
MNSIFNYFFESGITISVAAIFFLLVLNKEKSFLFNRFYLLGSVLLSLIIPLLHFDLGNIPPNLVAGTILLDTVELAGMEANDQFLFSFEFWIGCYSVFALLLLARIIYKVTALTRLAHTSNNSNHSQSKELTNSNEAFTFLNSVYVGDQISSEEKEIILSHEHVHAREKHSYDILFFEIVCAIFWINPIYLMIKKLARVNHEYLADAHAVNQYNKDSYVRTLAVHTIKRQGFALAHQFYNSSTLKRIKMINQQNNQIMKIKQITPFALGLAIVMVFGCEDATEQLSSMNDQETIAAITKVQTSAVKEVEGMKGVYDMVEKQPGPEGGMTVFYQWVAENMKYPTQARKAGVEGRVFVQFIVDKAGEITAVKSIKGIGAGCDAEAVRVMKSAARWTPGLVDGKPVSVRMIMPISFKLTSS